MLSFDPHSPGQAGLPAHVSGVDPEPQRGEALGLDHTASEGSQP